MAADCQHLEIACHVRKRWREPSDFICFFSKRIESDGADLWQSVERRLEIEALLDNANKDIDRDSSAQTVATGETNGLVRYWKH